MAWITKRTSKKYGIRYKAVVRKEGFPAQSRTFARKGEAEAWAANVEEQMHLKRFKDPRAARIALDRCLDKYERDVVSKNKPSTRERQKWIVTILKRHLGTDILLSEITPDMIKQYRDMRLRGTAEIKKVGASSVRLEMALLSDLFNVAKSEWGLPVENPVKEVPRPSPPAGRDIFLTHEQAALILEEAKKTRSKTFYFYLLTLLHTAMRPSEAARLQVKDILANGSIRLLNTKNGESRMVPMTKTLQEELRPLLQGKSAEHYLFIPIDKLPADMSFRPSTYFREQWEEARKRAKLPHVRLHDLRHTAASHLIMSGTVTDLRTLAAILGHKTLQMVMRYSHLLDSHLRIAIQGLNGLGISRRP